MPDESAAVVDDLPLASFLFNPRREVWRELAGCKGKPNEWWFPVNSRGQPISRETPKQYRRAKAICDACDVRGQCLEYALENNECCGMWGGLMAAERRRLRRERRKGEVIRFREISPGVFEST